MRITITLLLFPLMMACLQADPPLQKKFGAKANEIPMLFDAKTLSGWNVEPLAQAGDWTVVDAMIVGDNSGKKESVLWSDEDYEDFELSLEFQTDSPDYDSGVFLHGPSHQVQIGISRSLKIDLTACIYAPVDKQGSYPAKTHKVQATHQLGKWNKLRIVVSGKHIETFLNDEPMVDYTAIHFPTKGKIGLQLHGGVHQKMLFRDIQLTTKYEEE